MSIQILALETISAAQKNPVPFIGILTLLYELFVRLRPTQKNLSILDKIHSILNVFVPNWKEQTQEEVNKKIKSKFKTK